MSKFDPKRVTAACQEATRMIAANHPNRGAITLALDALTRVYSPSSGNFSAGIGVVKQAAVKLMSVICDEESQWVTPAQAPVKSGRFGADVTVAPKADAAAPLETRPLKVVARTGGLAYQACWGPCIHDMSGFIPPSGPIPLDWDHSTEVVGVADSVAIVDGQLESSGRLVPFTPDDMASEIIFKGSSGVPYQASIVQSPEGLVTESVPAGASVVVNGSTFTGPLTIFRQWSINGIAILPYGADSDTSVEFSAWKPGDPSFATVPASGLRDKMAETLTNQLKPDTKPRQGHVSGFSPALDRYIAKQQAKLDAAKSTSRSKA